MNGTLSTISQTVGSPPRVAILREEGSNGDREMTAAFTMAGFETYDLTMSDILECAKEEQRPLLLTASVQRHRLRWRLLLGDVLGSAKGWAAAIKFNDIMSTALVRSRLPTPSGQILFRRMQRLPADESAWIYWR